jgi:hypothetical protein
MSGEGYVAAQHAVPSDVDVVGYNPKASGTARVWVVSCKAWQSGFDPDAKLREMRGEKKQPKRATWRHFRELWVPRWSQAFRRAVKDATGETNFRYSVAVTLLKGDKAASEEAWMADPTIGAHLDGCDFSFLAMREMWSHIQQELTKTPASSEIGRLAQLLKAAKIEA